MLNKLIANPGGAFGLPTDSADSTLAIPLKSAESATTIARGDLVMWDLTGNGTILQHTTAGSVYRSVGVALEAIAPGEIGLIQIAGVARNVKAQGVIAQFDTVIRSGTTAGAVATDVPSLVTDIGNYVGIALSAAASNLVTLYLVRF